MPEPIQGDSKYGQLYTEDDLRKIIELVTKACGHEDEAGDEEFEDGILTHLEPTFPADEPLFLLRGQDNQVVPTVNCYVRDCSVNGVDPDHIHRVRNTIQQISDWQRTHSDRVKRPD